MAAGISTSLTIVSLCLGYAQTIMWVSALAFYAWIPISVLSSNGLAIDFVILNANGYFLLGLQDSYGNWFSGASYHYDVHISDMILSCCGLFYGAAGLCSIYLLPRSTPKKLSVVMGIIPITCMYLAVIFVAVTFQDFDYTMKTCGTIKGIQSLIAYIPQIHNNYKNKSTFGFSVLGIYCDCQGGILALVQIVFDYLRVLDNTSFWATVNCGKLTMNAFSILATVILFTQHHCIYGPIEPVIIGSTKQIQTKFLKKTSADYTFPPTDVTEITETDELKS